MTTEIVLVQKGPSCCRGIVRHEADGDTHGRECGKQVSNAVGRFGRLYRSHLERGEQGVDVVGSPLGGRVSKDDERIRRLRHGGRQRAGQLGTQSAGDTREPVCR
nr:hypothetical protein [Thermocrispum agreste]